MNTWHKKVYDELEAIKAKNIETLKKVEECRATLARIAESEAKK